MTASPRSRPILVIGATGSTGRALVAALRAEGVPVRAASRSSTPSADPGVESVAFDWADPSSHALALDGAGGIYVIPPPAMGHSEAVMLELLASAMRAGVSRRVLLSASSIEAGDPGPGRAHAELAAGPSGWAVLRPTWFAQNVVNPGHHLGATIAATGRFATAAGDGRVPFVDVADIAAVAARALLDQTPPDRDLVITGPGTLSYDDVAHLLSDALGRTIRHEAVSEEASAAAMVRAGMPPSFAAVLAGMEGAIARGSEDRTTDTVRRVTGRAPRAMVDVIADAVAGAGAPADERRAPDRSEVVR